MRLRKLLGGLFSAIAVLGLVLVSTAPAGADGNNAARAFTGTDPSNDAEFSTLCQVDDRNPDPYFGIPATGANVANCDNKIPQMDFSTYGLEYIPAGGAGALLDAAGNDRTWGTSDDPQGVDGKPGTADDIIPTATTGTIKATWTFAAGWPAASHPTTLVVNGSKNVENISGMSAFMAYRNADIQKNVLQAACDRNANTAVAWNGLSPTPTIDPSKPTAPGTTPAYIFDPRGALHHEDGTYFHIWVSWEYKGGTGTEVWNSRWQPKMNYGYYDPTIDNDIHYSETPANNPLLNPYNKGTGTNPWTGLGKFYSWEFSNNNQTLTVKFPAVYVDVDSGCLDQGTGANQEPYAYWPFARTAADKTGALAPRSLRTGQILNPGNGQDDKLTDIFARTMVSVRPTLPVPIPTGSVVGAAICPTVDNLPSVAVPLAGNVPPKCPNALRNDIDWVIGLGFFADDLQLPDGSDAFVGGFLGLPPSLGPGIMPGPTCHSPTFGGNLPHSPLRNPGNACAIRNPYSIGLRANPNHIHVF